MKMRVLTSILLLTAGAVSAEEKVSQKNTKPIQVEVINNSNTQHVKAGMMMINDKSHYVAVPSFAWGVRTMQAKHAVDYSIGFAGAGGRGTVYTLPKVNVLFLDPTSKNTNFYYGVGGAFGGIIQSSKDQFHGLLASGTMGYTTKLANRINTFAEVETLVPTIPMDKKGKAKPVFGLNAGVTF